MTVMPLAAARKARLRCGWERSGGPSRSSSASLRVERGKIAREREGEELLFVVLQVHDAPRLVPLAPLVCEDAHVFPSGPCVDDIRTPAIRKPHGPRTLGKSNPPKRRPIMMGERTQVMGYGDVAGVPSGGEFVGQGGDMERTIGGEAAVEDEEHVERPGRSDRGRQGGWSR